MEPDIDPRTMPLWKSHKQVRAMQITMISKYRLHFHGGGVQVSSEWMDKHNPQVGGYFVQYEDGYQSYSPAQAFQNGYTACEPA